MSKCIWAMRTMCLAAIAAITIPAAPLAAQQESSHVEVPVSRINQLTSRGDDSGNCQRFGEFSSNFFMVRLKSDGSTNTEPFIVPSGKNFVITDVVWNVQTRRAEGGFLENSSILISIEVFNAATPTQLRIATRLPFQVIPAGIDFQPLGGSQNFTAGVRVPAGHGICVRADAYQLRFNGSTRSSEDIYEAHVQGYLIKAP